MQLACAQARRQSQPAYSSSYYLPQQDGTGLEVMELCVPHFSGGTVTGYVVATYALREILASLVGPKLTRNQEVLFTEPDGTRLALYGAPQRGLRTFTSQQLLDLAGNTLVLRMNSWRGAPDPFPNVLTALVTAMLRVAKGLPNKVIADELDISVRTVEVHRARVFDKMNVKSAVELANSLRER